MLKNYSKVVQAALEKIEIGDRLRIVKLGKTYEGLLMPRSGTGDSNCIVIKLSSGYNIGIKYEKGVSIEKIGTLIKKEPVESGMKFDQSKPKVSLIMTGGTIVNRVDYRTGGVAPLESPDQLLSNIPEMKNIAFVQNVLRPFSKASEDFNYKDWQALAKLAADELNKNHGVIVGHGTDTMHYTSAALSFMLRNLSKPLVFVGSQRSSDRGSSDAFMNLTCAAHAAVSDIAEVGVCMHATTNDNCCNLIRGTKARKMHSSRRDAFRSINEAPIAKIWPDGRIDVNNDYRRRSDEKVSADIKFEPNVALLKAYPGSEPEVLEFLAKKGYKGFVIEGTGLGHVPTAAEKSWLPQIKKLTKDGIPVVITTQTIYGRVNTNVYTNLRILFNEAKAIPGEDMTSETAYVKLGWVLGHTKDAEETRSIMLTNIAGEITKRSEIDNFLV